MFEMRQIVLPRNTVPLRPTRLLMGPDSQAPLQELVVGEGRGLHTYRIPTLR